MPNLKPRKLFERKEFKLFFTVWIFYLFYLQMFGSSSMANTQSALTASIVNEGRLNIDTYHQAGGNGNAFYNNHYYSGQAPGISFISVPIYFISKQFFSFVPQNLIEQLFNKLENYGKNLPNDWEGKPRLLSNFFPALSKEEILEYVLISGFILPVFTTSLITALSVIVLYSFLKNFTKDERLRTAISLFYAFGTMMFPLSTEFFQRPIATALIFTSFCLLFSIKHNHFKKNKKYLLAAGFLAGLSVAFDYFHFALAGLLLFYLAYKIKKTEISHIFFFAAAASIPVLFLGLYQYSIFDDPFTTSYTYRYDPESNSINISKLNNLALPDYSMLYNMAIFFLYSPITLLAVYGIYQSLSFKSKNFQEALLSFMIVLTTFIFSAVVIMSIQAAHPLAQSSFKRYLKPILPFIFIFIPCALRAKNGKYKKAFFILGAISVFLNWISAQFGGHGALGHFDLQTKKFVYISRFIENGPQSSLLNSVSAAFNLNSFLINIIGILILVFLVFLIWRKELKNICRFNTAKA